MADPISSTDTATLQKVLSDLGVKVSNIYSLLQAKQAAELAFGGGGTDKIKEAAAYSLFKEAGYKTSQGMKGWSRSGKGGSAGPLDIVGKALASVKTSAVSFDKALKNLTQTTNMAARKHKAYSKEAINFSYSLGRGKYAAITPFMAERTSFGKLADMLTVGISGQWKNAALDPKFNLGKVLKRSKLGILSKAGLHLGRGLSGAAFGGGFAGLGTAGALGAGIWALGRGWDAIKTGAHGYSLAQGMAARGAGAGWGTFDIANAIFRGRMMGTSMEEAKGALTQGQALGLSLEQSMSALAATKAFGISGAPEKVQTIVRRFIQQFSDPARYFASLTHLTKETGLSLEELSNASQEAASAFRGQLNADAIRGVLGKYGKLVRTGEFSWGEIYSSLGAMQKMAPTQQIAAAHFAAMGGYNFRSGSALGRAYEVQRMGGGDIKQQASLLRAAIKGVLSAGGRGSWSSLSIEDKYAYGNMILGQMGLTDFYKQPGGEALMEKIMSNGLFTSEDQQAWENASMTSAEKVATKMENVINPLNQINTFVASIASRVGIESWARPLLEEVVNNQTNNTAQAPTIIIDNTLRSKVGLRSVPTYKTGGPVPIEVGGN